MMSEFPYQVLLVLIQLVSWGVLHDGLEYEISFGTFSRLESKNI
jgi:hypothetical protein